MNYRSSSYCVILQDYPSDFLPNQLPTGKEVLLLYLHFQRKNKFGTQVLQICQRVRDELLLIWDCANIPTVQHSRIDEKIRKIYKEYCSVKRDYKKKLETNLDSKFKRVDDFRTKCSTLFDISCKGPEGLHLNCKCSKCILRDQAFLEDQRSARKLSIDSVNIKKIQ